MGEKRYDSSDIDKSLENILKKWTDRDIKLDQCRFCNKKLEEPKKLKERFCDERCKKGYKKIQDAYTVIKERNIRKRRSK